MPVPDRPAFLLFRNPTPFFKNFFGNDCTSDSVLPDYIDLSEEKGHSGIGGKKKAAAGCQRVASVGPEENNGYFTF